MCSQSYLQHLLSLLYSKIGEIQPIYRRKVLIEVKVPKEIRESIFFGLSTRQFLCSLLAVGTTVGIYFGPRPFVGSEIMPEGATVVKHNLT